MRVIKKINNNVAVCQDQNGRQLIAFGKGIGFPPTPYELTDLRKIERTFYDVDKSYITMLADIPSNIIRFTATQLQQYQDELGLDITANQIVTLADHIAFAIERKEQNINVQLPSVYEMELSYPREVAVGRKLVAAVDRELHVKLPKSEAVGIAMHLVNAKNNSQAQRCSMMEEHYEEVLERTTQIIEEEMGIMVRRNTFSYARFATHIKFLIKRLFQEKRIASTNLSVFDSVRQECPEALACANKINQYYNEAWAVDLTEEEQLYLVLHINRVCAKEST